MCSVAIAASILLDGPLAVSFLEVGEVVIVKLARAKDIVPNREEA